MKTAPAPALPASASTLDNAPEKRLDLTQPIASRDDFLTGLAELCWCDSRKQTIELAAAAKHNLVNHWAAAELSLSGVDGVSIPDRIAALVPALKDALVEHRDTLFDGDSKTWKTAYGELALEKAPDVLRPIAGETETTVRNKIIEKAKIAKKVSALMAVLFAKLKLETWLRIKFEPAISTIKKAYQDQKINSRQLKSVGLEYVAGVDQPRIKLAAWPSPKETSAPLQETRSAA
ncbi:MAG: hypothetical protein AB7G12_12655 [Thermoanaerobaculia bacterium]